MTERQPIFHTPSSIRLGRLEALRDGHAQRFHLLVGEAAFKGFVVRKGEVVFGYVDRCPHTGLPLSEGDDTYLTPEGDLILCQQHGALFRIGTGLCIGGPCAGKSLMGWPVRIVDGDIVTA